ncbi:MAG TPA: monovalent cation/H(+) antiporter subunit G [Longimicrobiales bacterium]|nr:monovalent cation/H(+) antiporter subunit G [Longimicrobiales bacterium]
MVGQVAGTALIAAGIFALLLGSVGTWRMKGVYDRLHYAGLVNSVAAPLLALGVLAADGLSAASLRMVLLAALLFVSGPVLTHATARAALVREGKWRFDIGEGPGGKEGP